MGEPMASLTIPEAAIGKQIHDILTMTDDNQKAP